MSYKTLTVIVVVFITFSGIGQNGGSFIMPQINDGGSARYLSLGGELIVVHDSDMTSAISNPTFIDSSIINSMQISYTNYFTGLNAASASFGTSFKSIGPVLFTLQYLDFGNFEGMDETGNYTSPFSANQTEIRAGWSKHIFNKLQGGLNWKLYYSALEVYSSISTSLDFSAGWFDPENGFFANATVTDVGWQIKPFTAGNREKLPLNVKFGIAKQLSHAPIRVGIVLKQLNQWGGIDVTGNQINIGKDILRHVLFTTEFLPAKHFNIRLAYDYRKYADFKPASGGGMTGFSMGLGFKIKRLMISYGRGVVHPSGSVNTITLNRQFN